jgi:hypothetical protein
MGLPILTAPGMGMSFGTSKRSATWSPCPLGPDMMIMIGLGVARLRPVRRHPLPLRAGRATAAAEATIGPAHGRAVPFAGATVIALLVVVVPAVRGARGGDDSRGREAGGRAHPVACDNGPGTGIDRLHIPGLPPAGRHHRPGF